MRTLGGVVAVVLAAWLQVAFFGHLRPLGVMPNLMLVVVVGFGLWSNATPALAAASGGGFLLDLASGSDFGLRMAFFVMLALALVAGRQFGIQAEALITAIVAVTVGCLLYNLVVLAALGAPVSAIAISRVGRELVDDVVLLLLVCLIRSNLGRRRRTTLELGREARS